MHFGSALELSNADLLNIDLLDTNLDVLDTDIPSKYFARLHNDFKTRLQDMSSRRLQDMSLRRLQDVFKTNKYLLGSPTSNNNDNI